jgi:hypothetical protein
MLQPLFFIFLERRRPIRQQYHRSGLCAVHGGIGITSELSLGIPAGPHLKNVGHTQFEISMRLLSGSRR